MFHQRPSMPFSATRQRGSVLIQFAIFLSIIVLILGVVDFGYSFYAKRDLQRIADLAAMEAVQDLDPSNLSIVIHCEKAGHSSIDKNWPAPLNPVSKAVKCGEWSAKKYPAPRHFSSSATPANAAQVILLGESPRFIPGFWSREIRAEAIAQRSAPSASFQIGSQLLSLDNNALLGRVLKLVGLDVSKLTVLDSEGVANAKIAPSGLLKALGVNLGLDGLSALTPDQVASVNNLTLLQVINTSLDVADNDALKASLQAIIPVLSNAKVGATRLLDMKVPLLGDQSSGAPGILTFLSLGKDTSPNGAALDAQIGLGQLLKTAIMLGANGHALQVPELSIGNFLQTNLTVVEPPTIAVGPIGTKANSAQVRANLKIDSDGLPALGPLLTLMKLRVNLPISIEGVSGDATLNDIYCPDPDRNNQPSIDLGVISRIAGISIGDTTKSSTDPANLLIQTPLGGLGVRGPIKATALQSKSERINLIEGEAQWSQSNPLLIGDTLESLTNAIFNLLGGIFSPPTLDPMWSGMTTEGSPTDVKNAQIASLAKLYLEATKVNGFYNVAGATDLILKGTGTPGAEGYVGKLVDSDFNISHALPVSCVIALCPISTWKDGTFSQTFRAYTSEPGSLLDLLGISTIGNGYTSCSGLLSALLAWNSCVLSNLNTLLKQNSTHVNLTDTNSLVNSLKDKSSSSVTCNGALCVLLSPLLTPLKWLLNGLGSAVLSPILNNVLGLQLGRSEVKALDINCNAAQLVF